MSTTEAAALGVSLQVSVGEGRVAVLQTHIPGDCSVVELNEMLDKLAVAGERQRARGKIEEYEEEIEKLETTLVRYRVDLTDVDSNFAKTKIAIEAKMNEYTVQKDNALSAARDAHSSSERRGAFKPQGSTASAIRAAEQAIDNLQADLVKQAQERAVAHENLSKNVKRFEEEIARFRSKIARCESLQKA